jgi:hypothetical protein
MKNIKNTIRAVSALILILGVQSCSDFDKYEPLGSNSIADATPPSASFSSSQGAGPDEEWKDYTFANASSSATTFAWDFGDGNTSTSVDGANTYPGEGTWTVTLTASDALGVTSTFSETIEVVEPEEPDVPDPVLVNADFNKLPKSSGSDCACSGWINKDIGEQGESSSGNGSDVVKFDNNEPDHVYQEFAVTPNADYTIQIITQFKEPTGGPFPGMLELRVLGGTGYTDGYAPTYYTETVEFPQDGWGYSTIAQVEDAENNLLIEVQDNPLDDGYFTYTYTFNSGANESVALFIRGIGGDSIGDFGYTGGDEEIRADSVIITAIN